MMRNGTICLGGFIVLLAAHLAGCAGQTPRSNFYMLSADAKPLAGMEGDCSDQAISVGSISWPRYLDQPLIVTRVGTHRLEGDEFNRWGGSLEDGFVRTVIKNLSEQLNSELVVSDRRSGHFSPVYRVEIIVHQLDGQLGETVTLDAKWSIVATASGELEAVKTSLIERAISAPGYEALVHEYSRAIAQLSEEIAVQLTRLCSAGPAR